MMEAKRHVRNLMSVFDLSDCEDLKFPESAQGRVMLFYDEEKNRKEFKLLNKTIPKNMRGRITSWLENHFDVYDLTSC